MKRSSHVLWGFKRGREEASRRSICFTEGIGPSSPPTMTQALLLSIVLISVGSSLQQLQNLKDSEFVAPGGTTTISCRYDGGNLGDGNYPWWAQQVPGNKPRALIYQTSTRPSGVPAHFSGSRLGNVMSLTITEVLAEDEASYFCCVWTGSQWVFGGGTQLIITGQPTVSPSVQVFAPSREEVGGQNPYTVVCLVSEFYPPGFTLQWKDDKNQVIPSGAETTKATKQGDKYLASSYLRLSAPEYEKHSTFTCEVTHESKTIAKTVSKSGSC